MLKVEDQIRKSGLMDTYSGNFPSYGDLEGLHQFDWNVYHKKGLINWSWGGNSTKSRLLDKFALSIAAMALFRSTMS
jgi:hypothetical protein